MAIRGLYKAFWGLSVLTVTLVFPAAFCQAHVHIHSPNGGETLYADSSFTIVWHIHINHTILNWDLRLSTDNGGTWNDLVIDYDNTALSYDWTVPNINSTECLIWIIMDNVGMNYEDISDGVFTIVGSVGSEESKPDSRTPTFQLMKNYPNPFSNQTVIRYQLPAANRTTLEVFDLFGRLVETLVNEPQESGVYQVEWEAKEAPSGIYFYRIQSGDFIATKKLILLR